MEPPPAEPGQTPAPAAPGRKPVGWLRRIVSLALLGAAVALVVIQVTRLMRHEVQVWIELPQAVRADLQRLRMAVWLEGQGGSPASVTVFRFDAEHRPGPELEHTLRLPNGRYRLVFRLRLASNRQPLTVERQLEVSGEGSVRFALP